VVSGAETVARARNEWQKLRSDLCWLKPDYWQPVAEAQNDLPKWWQCLLLLLLLVGRQEMRRGH